MTHIVVGQEVQVGDVFGELDAEGAPELVRFRIVSQARNETRPYPAMSRSTRDFFLWLPGDDLAFFLRVEGNTDRDRSIHGFLSTDMAFDLARMARCGVPAMRGGVKD